MSRTVPIAGILVVALALSLAGCTTNYSISPELLPAPEAQAMLQPWPLTVGLYINPEVRSREFSRGVGRVEAGSELASTFRWALSQVFSGVVALDAPPGAERIPGGLAGIVELSDVALHEGDAPIVYEIRFYSGQGEAIDDWSLLGTTSLWDGERSSLPASLQTIGTALSYGIRNQTARFMVELPKQDSVKGWLEKAGIRQAPPRPFQARVPEGPQPAERVMILPNILDWRYTDNMSAMNCIGQRLRAGNPPVDVLVLGDAVRLEFFPWLEPSTGPRSIGALREWLAGPAVQEKMRELRVRYLLTFDGGTKTEMPGGGILCGGGGPAGGCFGFAWGSRDSSFAATVIDIREEAEPREVVSTQSSGVYMPAFVIPIPFLAPTESVACERIARDLHAIIAGKR